MPYIEVGKSRRYADRRVGLSVAMLFIAFMLVSNWMGSPEYAVEGSPDQEVYQELLPQEGHSPILAVPYEALEVGVYSPGEKVEGNPELTEALHEFEAAMNRHSCNVTGNRWKDDCKVDKDGTRFSNSFTNDAMPDPEAVLIIEPVQHNLKQATLQIESVNPETGPVSTETVAFRHVNSGYEED
jgi:hypothetical protein